MTFFITNKLFYQMSNKRLHEHLCENHVNTGRQNEHLVLVINGVTEH